MCLYLSLNERAVLLKEYDKGNIFLFAKGKCSELTNIAETGFLVYLYYGEEMYAYPMDIRNYSVEKITDRSIGTGILLSVLHWQSPAVGKR